MSEDRAMLERVTEQQRRRDHLPIQEKEEEPPPQKYFPGNNDFNIPLEKLLEGNHGRLL